MSRKVELRFRLNGTEVRAEVPAHRTLAEMLRRDLGMGGVRVACGEGECGSCTVLVNGVALASCLTMAVDADGAEVLTADGLRRPDGSLAAIPQALVDAGAVQCGFCMPGMAIAATALLRRRSGPLSRAEIARALEGNLCRCTGYVKAIDAIEAAAREEARA